MKKRSFGMVWRRPRTHSHRRFTAIQFLEARTVMTVATFQQGVDDYASMEDTVLFSREPDVNSGTEGSISPDQQDANGVRQGLMKFSQIIGDEPGQIPLGAKINSATLRVEVVNDSNSSMQMSLFRMQQDWSEATATWNSFGQIGGVQASEGEASNLPPDALLLESGTQVQAPNEAGIFDVSRSLEYWVAGAPNYGWLFESAATNGWDFRTKESAVSQRPKLTVDYEMPAGTQYQVLQTAVTVAEGQTGESSKALIEVARLGNLNAASSISYSVTAGTAGPSDFVGVPNGVLQFEAGQAYATFEVTLNGDNQLEGLETIQVQPAGGTFVTGRNSATVTIGDDDALINEVLANVTNADDETNREYIELIGTPGATLDGYYFVVFEGEEEGDDGSILGGEAAGVADFVFNLSGLSFGANGLLVLAPSNWEYGSLVSPQTTVVLTSALDGEGGVLEDQSQTYALIRSPNAPIVQGTDYDTIGTYEDQTNQAIGIGVGILDQLPAGAQLVDSVGVVEGGGGDRDRVATTAEQGHPGIHVHQPTPFTSGGNVTSDAVSRRTGQRLPNSIGAWFNGDISNGDGSSGPITYLNDSFFISVTAPDGSVLTPGRPNVLRNVFFRTSDQQVEVQEAAGSVTLTVERTGDLSQEITVGYRTVDTGSATAGVDFVPAEQTLTFGSGVSSRTLTIPLLSDSRAEGFERFRVELTSVSAGYLITDGRPSQFGAINGEAVVTIADANVSTKSFQNFVDDYTGNRDAYIDGEQIFDKFGQDPVVRVDQVKGEGEDVAAVVRPQQGLLRFDNMFGSGANQVPLGSTVFGAFLTVNVQNNASGAHVAFHRMLQDWEQVNANWVDPQGNSGNSIVNGVTPDDLESHSEPDFVVPDAGRAGLVEIPLNLDTIQAWANGAMPNFGWSIVSDSASLWAFNSSEAFLPGTVRPELTVLYTPPATNSEGEFGFITDEFVVNEDGSASVTVVRIGGQTGAVSVNWQASVQGDDTASLADLSGSTSGTISFADGELFKTITVSPNNDALLEPNETLTLSLSGSGRTFTRQNAQLVIRDNDFNPNGTALLLNEFWINSPGNDPPHEFVELVGQPGIGMGSLYFVAIEGLVGDHEGTAEKVVDIGRYNNGANGLTLITPSANSFGFQVPSGATQIDGLGTTNQENLSSQNDSTTYMLLYSPFTRLTTTEFDYDWDNDGALELPQGVQIVDSVGVRVLGVEDQLYGPLANQTELGAVDADVDAISRIRGDVRRSDGRAWFGGDLFPAGDDYLLYEAAEASGLPVKGAALSPGEQNVSTQSSLVGLLNVSATPEGMITATFNGPISQVLAGDGSQSSPGGAGITITDPNGQVLPTVDPMPTSITGFGTNTLTISFGSLPAGNYRVNFVGNAIIGNGRAVDTANSGLEENSFRTFAFSSNGQGGNQDDRNNDGVVNLLDLDLICAAATAGTVSRNELNAFLTRQRVPAGDSNFDHEFNSGDLVTVFAAGRYETGQSAVWSQGDWNCDGRFDSADLVAAFAAGGYEQGPVAAIDEAFADRSDLTI